MATSQVSLVILATQDWHFWNKGGPRGPSACLSSSPGPPLKQKLSTFSMFNCTGSTATGQKWSEKKFQKNSKKQNWDLPTMHLAL